MLPYSGMKVIHDQMIDESLERQRHYIGQETHRQGLLKTFGKALARFTAQSGHKQESILPGSAGCARGEA